MAELFSAEWMSGLMDQWNADPELADARAQIGFNSNLGYGFDHEAQPRGVLMVLIGRAVAGTVYDGQTLNWDVWATPENWQ